MFLRIYPELHFFNSLPQEEELFDLSVILAMETQEVFLCHFLRREGLVAEETGLGVIGLEKLVEIPLDPELILQSLDGALKMLEGETEIKFRVINGRH